MSKKKRSWYKIFNKFDQLTEVWSLLNNLFPLITTCTQNTTSHRSEGGSQWGEGFDGLRFIELLTVVDGESGKLI